MADEEVDKTPEDEETAETPDSQQEEQTDAAEEQQASEAEAAAAEESAETETAAAEEAPEDVTAQQVAQESAAATLISPNIGFVREIIGAGGDSLKKCYQCAQCSVVCNITPDENPFPRKEMMWAQWGLKEKLIGNADIWLCHQCADCTANCPRGAEPGRVMQAIGRLTLGHYSKPGFLARALGSPKALLALIALPLLVILVSLGAQGSFDLNAIPRGDDDGIVYRNFMNVHLIDAIYTVVFLFAAGTMVLGAYSYWKDMTRNAIGEGKTLSGGLISNIVPTVTEILSHRRFNKCETTKSRTISHMFLFYSFIGLLITTTWAAFYTNIMKMNSPYAMVDPLKIVGNTSAVAFLVGMTLILVNRFRNAEKAGIGNYYDWLLIVLIYTVGLSGVFTEVIRLANLSVYLAYPMYVLHLVSVLFLFLYAPYSKMAHMMYRAIAMVFARAAGREPAS